MVYIFFIAVSLALDAFAVSVTLGLTGGGGLRRALRPAVYFGFFQFAMPIMGWALGRTVADFLSAVSPWISFGLLAFIGGRMIWGALRGGNSVYVGEPTAARLLALAVATSIDALAVGVTFAFMEVNILLSCAVIGLVAFALSIVGGLVGGKLGGKFQSRAEIIGGCVLIGIGLKILLENLL